jgi:hypothetical protein
MNYPGYQCFKTDSTTVYCSLKKVNNHGEGNDWIKAACANFNLRIDQIYGEPFISTRRPMGAIIWPYGLTIRHIWSASNSVAFNCII